jgi:hypothetical protein
MSELIMPVESVIKILNLLPQVEGHLNFDERTAIQAFIHGDPTDEQQAQVLYICQAVMDTRQKWELKNGKGISF